MEFNATFIVAFISFIIFTVLMNIILYKPINKIVKERQDFIDNNYNEAKYNSTQADNILKDKEDKINDAKAEARNKFASKSDELKLKKNKALNLAKNNSKEELNNKKIEFINKKNEVTENLKDDIVSIAQLISNKFLGQEEKIEEIDHNLIEKIMQG